MNERANALTGGSFLKCSGTLRPVGHQVLCFYPDMAYSVIIRTDRRGLTASVFCVK